MKELKPNRCSCYTKQILGLLTILFLFSCNSEQLQHPKGIISQDVMSKILADIKIVDAAYQAGIAPSNIDSSYFQDSNLINIESKSKLRRYEAIKAKIRISDSLSKIQDTLQNDTIINADVAYEPVDYAPTSSQNIYRAHLGADYDFVFKKYNVTREKFDKSIDYYSRQPEVFYSITEMSLSILSEYLIQVQTEAKADSIATQ